MNRRSFLTACLATFTAPSIVRAESLMRISLPYVPILWGDGIHDDTKALQAAVDGLRFRTTIPITAEAGGIGLDGGIFRICGDIHARNANEEPRIILRGSFIQFDPPHKHSLIYHVTTAPNQ